MIVSLSVYNPQTPVCLRDISAEYGIEYAFYKDTEQEDDFNLPLILNSILITFSR